MTEKKERKPGSGGARPGGGRKPKGDVAGVNLTVRIHPDAETWYKGRADEARLLLENYWKENTAP